MIPDEPQAALALVAEARDTSSRALNDLRNLVRGIYPPVLADRGLGHAVRALALDTPMPVGLDIDLPGRLTAPVESACYFAVAEVAGQRGQALRRATRPCPHRSTPTACCGSRWPTTASAARTRPAAPGCGRGAAAGYLRWHPGREQPAGRTDHGRHGGAMRVVVAEDLFLLRDGLARLLGAYGFEIAAAVDTAPALLRALLEQRPDVAIVDVRLPPAFADDGLRAALAARQQVPGLPGAAAVAVRRAALRPGAAGRPGRRGRLPAQGPGVQRRPVRRRDPRRGRRAARSWTPRW